MSVIMPDVSERRVVLTYVVCMYFSEITITFTLFCSGCLYFPHAGWFPHSNSSKKQFSFPHKKSIQRQCMKRNLIGPQEWGGRHHHNIKTVRPGDAGDSLRHPQTLILRRAGRPNIRGKGSVFLSFLV